MAQIWPLLTVLLWRTIVCPSASMILPARIRNTVRAKDRVFRGWLIRTFSTSILTIVRMKEPTQQTLSSGSYHSRSPDILTMFDTILVQMSESIR